MFRMISSTCLPNFMQIGFLLKELQFFKVGFLVKFQGFRPLNVPAKFHANWITFERVYGSLKLDFSVKFGLFFMSILPSTR